MHMLDKPGSRRNGCGQCERRCHARRTPLRAVTLLFVSHAGAPHQNWPPPFQRKVRKVGAPLIVLILLATVAGLILIGLTALNPVGTAIGFVLSSLAMVVVLLCYVWLDRWEPEPPRLLIFAFLWGASVAVVLSVILGLYLESVIAPGGTESVSWASTLVRAR